MTGSFLQTPRLALYLALGVLVLIGGGALLSALSTPDRAEARLAGAAQIYREASLAAAAPSRADRYPSHAVCADASRAGDALKARFAGAALRSGAKLGELRLEPSSTPEQMLTTLTLEADARGQEGELKGLLAALAAEGPVVILDTLDLSSNGAETALRLKGRMLCRERRLP